MVFPRTKLFSCGQTLSCDFIVSNEFFSERAFCELLKGIDVALPLLSTKSRSSIR
jgi:hypothetical protein